MFKSFVFHAKHCALWTLWYLMLHKVIAHFAFSDWLMDIIPIIQTFSCSVNSHQPPLLMLHCQWSWRLVNKTRIHFRIKWYKWPLPSYITLRHYHVLIRRISFKILARKKPVALVPGVTYEMFFFNLTKIKSGLLNIPAFTL